MLLALAKGTDWTEVVPANQTYYEWLKGQDPDFQKEAIGKTRAELLRSGELSAERFAELNLKNTFEPQTLAEMRALDEEDLKRAFGSMETAEESVEPLFGIQIVIVIQHRQKQALTEPAGA